MQLYIADWSKLSVVALAGLQERFQSLNRRLRELQATCDQQETMYRAFADGAATRRADLNRIRQLVQQQVGRGALQSGTCHAASGSAGSSKLRKGVTAHQQAPEAVLRGGCCDSR